MDTRLFFDFSLSFNGPASYAAEASEPVRIPGSTRTTVEGGLGLLLGVLRRELSAWPVPAFPLRDEILAPAGPGDRTVPPFFAGRFDIVVDGAGRGHVIACRSRSFPWEVLIVPPIPLNADTARSVIADSWQAVINRVEAGHPVASEKTLCFLLAMEVRDRCGPSIHIDFENQCYAGLQGESKYLDLLLYTDPQTKVAVEVKMPKKSQKGNSDQTATRAKVYRDLARLSHLRQHSFACACFFLMATNENPYLNNSGTGLHPSFITRQGHTITAGNQLIAEGLPLNDLACVFQWTHIKQVKGKWSPTGRFAWLGPIEL